MTDIADQNVIVTGANRGIGRVIAREFVRQGATVGLLGRRPEAINGTIEEFEDEMDEPVDAHPVVADVTEPDQVEEAIDGWVDDHDLIHTLVNNAGTTRDGLLIRMKDEDWKSVLDLNLDGAFHCTRAVVQKMLRNRWGRIIMISSIAGLRGNPGQTNYSASKAGLIGFAKSVARELGSRDITCNTVAPGFVRTDLTEDLTDEQVEYIEENTPLERFGTAQEIADCVQFLASPRASYITGEVIRVDGGMAM